MKIYFVRHGKTQNDCVIGQINAPLIREGVEETEKTFLELSDDYEEMYSSDLLKCKQTANILNKKLNLQIKHDYRLRERDFGSLSGKRFIEIDSTGQMAEKDKNQQYDYRLYGGESVEDVKKRLFAFIKDVLNNSKDKKVLVVTHGGIIRLLYSILDNKVGKKVKNSSIHEFNF